MASGTIRVEIYATSVPPWVPEMPEGPLAPAGAGGDIRVIWSNVDTLGDWGLADGDVEAGQDLETACLVSLFTDRLATPDFSPTDGTSDRRGWWGDPYLDHPLGSNLWQLERAKKTRDTLGRARNWTLDALGWLVEDGIASRVLCNTMWLTPTMLGIAVALLRPDGSVTRFHWAWAWDDLATVSSPILFPDPFPELQRLAVR